MTSVSRTRGGPSGAGIDVEQLEADYGSGPVLRDVTISIGSGEIVALLGPSGCGKTTLLRCIAGLEHPSSGTIRLGDVDVTTGRGVRAERRHVGMVFQDGALFPHRTVLQNVRYGLPRAPDRDQRARDALELVGLGSKADRMPGTLSGGEQQRVALARAIAPRPGVVLLDEPFSSLDASLRVQLRDEVRRLCTELGVTTVLVTHDQHEALSFGDRLAVMFEGHIQQIGTPEQVYATPATPWVAQFVGEAVLLPAQLDGTVARTPLGDVTMRNPAFGEGTVLLRPEQLIITAGQHAEVARVSYFGAETRYEVDVDGLDTPVIVRTNGAARFQLGERVEVRAGADAGHAWTAEQRPAPR